MWKNQVLLEDTTITNKFREAFLPDARLRIGGSAKVYEVKQHLNIKDRLNIAYKFSSET